MRHLLLVCLASVFAMGCDDESVDSNEDARRAYLGLDLSIEKSIELGFLGFNSATNANISPQTTAGTAGGTLTVTGQVDQGVSANKEMRLNIGMVAYDEGDIVVNDDGDTIRVVYDTNTDPTMQPYLDLKLMDIPTGTLSGTLTSNTSMTGVYVLSGDIIGELTLDLTISGMLMAGTGTTVVRVPGTTTVTGTATNSDGGVYEIDLMF